MDDWRAEAAADNADWCDLVSRSHGADGRFAADAWTSPTRTPPLYPDAVTLRPGVVVADLLARIDPSPGCSVKDSFGDLDLSGHGFRVLFDARWVVLTEAPRTTGGPGPRWERIVDADGFADWERAWRGADGPSGVLRADLLGADPVVVLGGFDDDRLVAGAILHRSRAVAGISNVFAVTDAGAAPLDGCLALATSIGPGPIVGYESGDALDAALAHGFEDAGPLRVWISDR